MGQELIFEIPEEHYGPISPVTVTLIAGRFYRPAQGILGGLPGLKGSFFLNDEPQDWGGQVQAKPGDILRFRHPGGGGYGNPYDRPSELVEDDVRKGYVSVDGAKKYYGVVIDDKTLKVDKNKTKKLRNARGK